MLPSSWSSAVPALSSLAAEPPRGLVIVSIYQLSAPVLHICFLRISAESLRGAGLRRSDGVAENEALSRADVISDDGRDGELEVWVTCLYVNAKSFPPRQGRSRSSFNPANTFAWRGCVVCVLEDFFRVETAGGCPTRGVRPLRFCSLRFGAKNGDGG